MEGPSNQDRNYMPFSDNFPTECVIGWEPGALLPALEARGSKKWLGPGERGSRDG